MEVVVDFRSGERRRAERRAAAAGGPPAKPAERRRVRSEEGRRIAERRALTVPVAPLPLPRKAGRYADRLLFVERLEPTTQQERDAENTRLVARYQAGDSDAFSDLYLSNFDSVYTYLRVALKDVHEAEDAAQQIFTQVLQHLPAYEIRRGVPFRAWLFRIARNQVLSHYRKHKLVEVEDPEEIGRERVAPQESELRAIDWLSDTDLMIVIERLPPAQRQAVMLRYMLGLTTDEMATILERSPAAVRKLEHRAMRFLEQRLAAIGRRPVGSRRSPMLVRLRRAPVLGARRFALTGADPGGRLAPRRRHWG